MQPFFMKYIVSITLIVTLYGNLLAQGKTSTLVHYQGYYIDDLPAEKVNGGRQYPYPFGKKMKVIIPDSGDTCLIKDSNNNTFAVIQISSKGIKLNFEGRLTEYYPNGKVRTKGYYHNNEKIGLWEFYYPNGNLKEQYTIGKIIDTNNLYYHSGGIIGTYEYYYENGDIREQGQYSLRRSVCTDSIRTIDPISQEEYWRVENVPCWHSIKAGYWNTYNEQGVVTEEKYYNEDAE